MIRLDEIWLATEPLDMLASPDAALARVVKVFGAARPRCAYLFANRRDNRMKVLIAKYADHMPLFFARSRSSPGPVYRSRVLPWLSGSASAACASSR